MVDEGDRVLCNSVSFKTKHLTMKMYTAEREANSGCQMELGDKWSVLREPEGEGELALESFTNLRLEPGCAIPS